MSIAAVFRIASILFLTIKEYFIKMILPIGRVAQSGRAADS